MVSAIPTPIQLAVDAQYDIPIVDFATLQNTVVKDRKARTFSGQELTSTHEFVGHPVTKQGFDKFVKYETDTTHLGFNAGWATAAEENALTTWIIVFPAADSVNVYDITIGSQSSSRYSITHGISQTATPASGSADKAHHAAQVCAKHGVSNHYSPYM